MKALYKIAFVTVFVLAPISVAYAQWGTATLLVDGWKSSQKIEAGKEDVSFTEYLQAGAYCGYIMGFLHGTGDTYKIPTGATPKQLFWLVGKYLDAHPEKWSDPPQKIVYEALSMAFPR
jgi:hypothetical protein